LLRKDLNRQSRAVSGDGVCDRKIISVQNFTGANDGGFCKIIFILENVLGDNAQYKFKKNFQIICMIEICLYICLCARTKSLLKDENLHNRIMLCYVLYVFYSVYLEN
jgi:hypothetical protein